MLPNSQHKCVCHSQLNEHNIPCNISDQTVHRSGNMWLSVTVVGNTTNGVIIHSYCPFDYCKNGEMNIELENPDSQCAFNRVGILCGGCQSGLSIALVLRPWSQQSCSQAPGCSHLQYLITCSIQIRRGKAWEIW